ncbi:MAG: SDR family oxidoreductase [Kiritimatiellae bacterium]|nr:SDR family oxidoreductase [Kiritimatiellia bacterium]
MDLNGKKALVTGGAVRIGRAICLGLAEAGADVLVHCRVSKAEAEALAQEIGGRGGKAWVVQEDLSDDRACERLVTKARAHAGGLDILVNNAAMFRKDTLRTVTADAAAEQLWTNLLAPMMLMRLFAEGTSTGAIVNLLDSRIAGLDRTSVSYVLSKKGLAELTQLAALEFAPGIRVNGVAPGAVLPPVARSTGDEPPPGGGPDRVRELAGASPLERLCTPEEVAAAVVFVLRNDALTGQIVCVDAGQHLLGGPR